MSIVVISSEKVLRENQLKAVSYSLRCCLLHSVCFIIISVLLLEGYFRLAGVGGGEYLQPDLVIGRRHIPGKQVIWRWEGYSDDLMSTIGLRDSEHALAKQPGVYRIALLGDSAVESLQVSLNDTFGKKLESLLNQRFRSGVMGSTTKFKRFEVINFGCSGYSTAQETLLYEKEVVKFQPDAIVLLYNCGDSNENSIMAGQRRYAEPRSYFYFDKYGNLQEDESVLRAHFDKLRSTPIFDFLRRNSRIYGVISQADFNLTINDPRYFKMKKSFRSIWNYLTLANFRRSRKPTVTLYPDQNNMDITEALIKRMVKQAESRKQVFILSIFPHNANNQDENKQTKKLYTIAREYNFLCIDLSTVLMVGPNPKDNFLQYHLSKQGHMLVADYLYRVFSSIFVLGAREHCNSF